MNDSSRSAKTILQGAWQNNLEVALLNVVGPRLGFVVLAGSTAIDATSQLGVVGICRRVSSLEPESAAISAAFSPSAEQRTPRLVLLPYEFGYELLALPTPPNSDRQGKIIDLGAALVIDHRRREVQLCGDDPNARAELEAAVNQIKSNRAQQYIHKIPIDSSPDQKTTLHPEVSDSSHKERIATIKRHIAAGDIYQANLTRTLVMKDLHVDSTALFGALTAANPVPHGAYIKLPELELVSNTMETLLTYEAATRRVSSLPIKGTYRRTSGRKNSDRAATAFRSDPKERAEHIMIVDLVRNDLGRVCKPGSVKVPELFGAHAYFGVWHGVSTISGILANEQTPGSLCASIFPGGSITGAPKRRAVELIAAIESRPRGYYTGSLALVMPSGDISASILIRTMVRDTTDDGDSAWTLGVGGGIVADSDPAREVQEMDHKIAVFRHAFGRLQEH